MNDEFVCDLRKRVPSSGCENPFAEFAHGEEDVGEVGGWGGRACCCAAVGERRPGIGAVFRACGACGGEGWGVIVVVEGGGVEGEGIEGDVEVFGGAEFHVAFYDFGVVCFLDFGVVESGELLVRVDDLLGVMDITASRLLKAGHNGLEGLGASA